jgi:periodic tryptophan protein 2
VSTLDGQILFFDVAESKQTSVIEGRKDISGGRSVDDRMTAANNASSKYFNSLAYTADGSCVIAGGSSKYVVIYDVRDGVMVKKFQISENLSLDGTQEFLDSRRLTEAGPIDSLDLRGDEEDLADRLDPTLPGAQRGDLSKRRYRRAARTMCVRFSPTGRTWAAASTEGLLIYGLDETTIFDPFDLDIDITPETLLETISEGDHLLALIMAFRLNERPLLLRAYESTPPSDIRLIARQIPQIYLLTFLRFIASHLESSPHVEFDLMWIGALLTAHGRYLSGRSSEFSSVFRGLQKGVGEFEQSIARL